MALIRAETSREAQALEARQIASDSPTIRWINSLNYDVRSLKLAIKQYANSIEAIRTAESNLDQDMAEGNTKIASFADYGVAESTLIFSELSKLQGPVEDLVYNTIDKRSLFVRTNNRYFIRFIFEREWRRLEGFMDTIKYKVPEETRGLLIQTLNGMFAA